MAIIYFSLVASFVTSIIYYRTTNHKGRKLSLFSIGTIPLMNGILESIYFWFTFDLGVWLTQWLLPRDYLSPFCTSILEFTMGFHTFSLYSGVVHAVMWGAMVLPPGYDLPRDGTPRTQEKSKKLLKFLILNSTLWLISYYVYHDPWNMIICHIIADIGIDLSVRNKPPWSQAYPYPPARPLSSQ